MTNYKETENNCASRMKLLKEIHLNNKHFFITQVLFLTSFLI